MLAVVIHGKLDLRVEEVPTPDPAEGQVRLRTAFGGVCGSDLHYYYEGANGEYPVREPLVPGHEISGTVDLDPSGELAPGTPVTVRIGTEDVPPASFDVVPECSGVPAAVGPALVGARRGGVVVQVGMVPDEARPVNRAPLVAKELQLRGSFRFDDEIDEAVELLAAHPGIEDVITHEVPAAARDSAASGTALVSLRPAEDR